MGIRVRMPYEIGQLIRYRRESRGMTQADLAKAIETSRKWVIEAEAGKPTAEIGRVLRALSYLGVILTVEPEKAQANSPSRASEGASSDQRPSSPGSRIPDIETILAAQRRR